MPEYFDLDLALLQHAVAWAKDYVAEALEVYRRHLPDDPRPEEAYREALAFLSSGKRTNALRKVAMAAYKSSRETTLEAARHAANACSLLAALAYTHPFRDARQARHILGPIAYAILALESEHGPAYDAEKALQLAIQEGSREVRTLLGEYPRQVPGKARIDELCLALDRGIAGSRGWAPRPPKSP